jgi:hypothetical protein
VSDDSYHDDPVEEIPKKSLRSKFLSTGVVIVGSIFFLQSTLAGNISLNSGAGIEFGQGVTQTVACSGGQNVTMTPKSSFVNAANSGGTHNFSSVTVSGIPDSCNGAQFQINAYGDSNQSPLALYNSTTRDVIVSDTGGTFSLDIRASGITLTVNSSSSFTVTFDTPVATSDAVFKLTIQSTTNSTKSTYSLGDTGPGGGKIFYYSAAGFSCGPTGASTCKYLEVAPNNWSGGTDPTVSWAQSGPPNLAEDTVGNRLTLNADIGRGARNTKAIIDQGNTDSASSAAARADSYSVVVNGVNYDDWILPSENELSQLFIQRNVVGMVFAGASYWSSTSPTSGNGRYLIVSHVSATPGTFAGDLKTRLFYVRPIRAF